MVVTMRATVSCTDWADARAVELPEGSQVQALLDRLGLRANAVLVLLDGRPVPENAPVEDGREYRVIRVASGG